MARAFRVFKRESSELVIVTLRFAVGAVFLWFGIDKWIHPLAWNGWLPAWLLDLMPVSVRTLLWLQGAFEFALGAMLVGGRKLRAAAVVAVAALLYNSVFSGINEATIRDNALIGACLALFIHANAQAEKPVEQSVVQTVCSLYLFFLFITGVLYLRAAPL